MIRPVTAVKVRARIKGKLRIAAAGALTCMASPALAQDEFRPAAGDITLRTGPAVVLFDSSARLQIAGQDLAGADLQASDNFTGSIEAEAYVMSRVSISLTVGIPPETTVEGRGILTPVGELGSVRFGIGAVLVKFHLSQSSRFQPFVATGVAHFVSFKEKGLAVANLDVDDSWGAAIQVGADYMLTPRVGIYASATYSAMKTNGKGAFGGAPITADIKLNPTVLQGGLLFRF